MIFSDVQYSRPSVSPGAREGNPQKKNCKASRTAFKNDSAKPTVSVPLDIGSTKYEVVSDDRFLFLSCLCKCIGQCQGETSSSLVSGKSTVNVEGRN